MAEPYLEIPKSWTRIALEPLPLAGYVVDVTTGSTPRTSVEDYWDGDIPWLTPKEVSRSYNGIYFYQTERTISELGLKNSSAKLLPPNTVMLTKRAPVGAVAVNAVPMATNQGFLNFTCGKNLDPLYLAYWLRVNKPYLEKVANGSTYPELYSSNLFEFEMGVPPLAEQKNILRVVSALQYVIAQGFSLEYAAISPDKIFETKKQNLRLLRIRDIMLPLLFSGTLPVPSLNLEEIEEYVEFQALR
jgi:type I restriction enzyme S subunit